MTDCEHKHIKCMDCMRELPVEPTGAVSLDNPELQPALDRIKELEKLNGDLGYQLNILKQEEVSREKPVYPSQRHTIGGMLKDNNTGEITEAPVYDHISDLPKDLIK